MSKNQSVYLKIYDGKSIIFHSLSLDAISPFRKSGYGPLKSNPNP
jgi:hypothetical protein